MNERIESLWKDATSYANEATSDLDVWHGIRQKKFAELIVRDCMRMCEVSQVSLLTHGLREQSYGASNAKQHISDWFGVEE
jgi:hypothetical protein